MEFPLFHTFIRRHPIKRAQDVENPVGGLHAMFLAVRDEVGIIVAGNGSLPILTVIIKAGEERGDDYAVCFSKLPKLDHSIQRDAMGRRDASRRAQNV